MPIRCCICLLALAVAWAPGQTARPALESAAADQVPSTDAGIEKAIRARFAASKISSNNFQVRVRDGVAVIGGRTDVVQHKGTATRLAKLAGADSVDNRIEVTERGRSRASRATRPQPRRVHVRRSRTDGHEDR